jgi:hypothetical protein
MGAIISVTGVRAKRSAKKRFTGCIDTILKELNYYDRSVYGR